MGKIADKPTVRERSPRSTEDKASAPKRLPGMEALRRKIQKISNSIPDEEWAKIPADGSMNVDHYLYGTPRRS